jgi:hypothetical protein
LLSGIALRSIFDVDATHCRSLATKLRMHPLPGGCLEKGRNDKRLSLTLKLGQLGGESNQHHDGSDNRHPESMGGGRDSGSDGKRDCRKHSLGIRRPQAGAYQAPGVGEWVRMRAGIRGTGGSRCLSWSIPVGAGYSRWPTPPGGGRNRKTLLRIARGWRKCK